MHYNTLLRFWVVLPVLAVSASAVVSRHDTPAAASSSSSSYLTSVAGAGVGETGLQDLHIGMFV
jgi:hypothetical protein